MKTCKKPHRASNDRDLCLNCVLHIPTYFVKRCCVKIYLDQLQRVVGLLISWKGSKDRVVMVMLVMLLVLMMVMLVVVMVVVQGERVTY